MPATTLSLAYSKSFIITYEFPFLAAIIAASLQRLAISAPLNPGVSVARRLAIISTDGVGLSTNGFKCTRNISERPFKSGRVTSIDRSNRPGRKRAGSSNS